MKEYKSVVISAKALKKQQEEIEKMLNETASEGWIYRDQISSQTSRLFIFEREM